MTSSGVRIVRVDDAGVLVRAPHDELLNVHFDGRRIWSFWARRDGSPASGRGEWLVEWPQRLRLHLQGTTRLSVHDASGSAIFDEEVTLGTKQRRITVVDRQGEPLGVDNYGRLIKTFETKDRRELEPVLDALGTVLDLLATEGLAAFPAYGTLLAAVREGRLIGHDSDADVGYVSHHDHPLDVIRESHRVQRAIQRQGYSTTRHSGAAFKVDVRDADGTVRGLDVFAGFFVDNHLALMGEVWAPYEREWIFPLGTVELEGRSFPAPAVPEKLLEQMYGPGWKVPDPAFRFTKDPRAQRRFDGWFRGSRTFRAEWDHRYGLAKTMPPRGRAHDLARVVHEREPADAWVLEVGCGRGRDSRWLARQGRSVVGFDFSSAGMGIVRQQAAEEGLDLDLVQVNLLELRHVLGRGLDLALRPGPRTVMARHVIDSTTPEGVENFWRLVGLVLRDGGRVHLEFLTSEITDPRGRPPLTSPLDPDAVVADIEARGGTLTQRTDLVGQLIDYGYDEKISKDNRWRTCRLEVDWK